MITCTLGEKKYTVDYITGRALREMEPAAKMYAKIVAVANAAAKGETVPEEQQFTIPEAMDVMIRWFCLLFGNQFTVDDVLDHYPVDRLMHDVALALLGRADADHRHPQRFPYDPGSDAGGEEPGLTLPEFIYSTYNSLLESGWRMDEIDRMDMPGFFRSPGVEGESREAKHKEPRRRYIDEVWKDMRPGA